MMRWCVKPSPRGQRGVARQRPRRGTASAIPPAPVPLSYPNPSTKSPCSAKHFSLFTSRNPTMTSDANNQTTESKTETLTPTQPPKVVGPEGRLHPIAQRALQASPRDRMAMVISDCTIHYRSEEHTSELQSLIRI